MKTLTLSFVLAVAAACQQPPACQEASPCPDLPNAIRARCSWGGYEATGATACFARGDLVGLLCEEGVEEEIEVLDAEIVCEPVDDEQTTTASTQR